MLQTLKLSPEQVRLAFLCLVGKEPYQNLPPELKELDQEEWQQLATFLVALEKQKELESLH